MAQHAGQRSTLQAFNTENRVIRVVDDKISMVEPNIAPCITLMLKMGQRASVSAPRFEWNEDEFIARWAQVSTATVGNTTSANTIALVAGHGSYVVPGDVLIVPKVVTSSSAPEMLRVTTISTDTITVTRAFGGSTVDTIYPSSALRLIGSAYAEGAALPSVKNTYTTTKISYTQIMRRTLDLTKTQIATKLYSDGGNERKRQHKKMLQEVKEQMNAALWWGKAYEDLTGTTPIRTTMGINSVVSTNVVDAGGTLTQKLWDSFCDISFRFGKKEKWLFTSGSVTKALNAWARTHLMLKPSDSLWGVSIDQIKTPFGVFNLVNDYMLENPNNYNQTNGWTGNTTASSAYGFGGCAFAIDMDNIKYRYLEGGGQNRDVKLTENKVEDGADRLIDEVLAEIGFSIKEERTFAKLFNVQDYQA